MALRVAKIKDAKFSGNKTLTIFVLQKTVICGSCAASRGHHISGNACAAPSVNRGFIPSMVTARRDLTGDRAGCDETHPQGKNALPSGSAEMNAVQYAHFVTAEISRPSESEGAPAPRPRLPVRSAPPRKPMTPEERHADMMRRFPRTMAYLAEH